MQIGDSFKTDIQATPAADQMSMQKETDKRPVAEPAALAQATRDHTNSTSAENDATVLFIHPQSVQSEIIQK